MKQASDFWSVDLWSGQTQCPVQKVRSPQQLYKDRLTRATPAWADLRQIYRVYDEAFEMRESGIPATVDHIYPLAGKGVCGLHVHQNLQIVTNAHNSRKNNTSAAIPVLPKLPSSQGELF